MTVMRTLALLLTVCTAQVRPVERCTLEGVVTNAVTGKPVRKVAITVTRLAGIGDRYASYAALSGPSGEFAITGIEPGSYVLSAYKTGFLPLKGPQSVPVPLQTGAAVKKIALRLVPGGIIAGRVLDEDGEPVSETEVQALNASGPVKSAPTNDLGEFRLYGLEPGKYVLRAEYSSPVNDATANERAVESYLPTWYPESTSPQGASPIAVSAGTSAPSLDIRLIRGARVRVSGRISGIPESAELSNLTVALVPRAGVPVSAPRVLVLAGGEFVADRVTPGSYTVYAAYRSEPNDTLSARAPIEVGSTHIDNLVLSLAPGARLPGRVVAEGAVTFKTFAPRIASHLAGGSTDPRPVVTGWKEDGSFTLTNIHSGVWDLLFTPPDSYVKSVRLGAQETLESGLDFRNGIPVGEITITVSDRAGRIEGAVRNAAGEPAQSALVALVPEVKRRNLTRFYKGVNTGEDGKYALTRLPPGDYLLFAFDKAQLDHVLDPDWLKPFESKGEKITIAEGERQFRNLTLTPVQEP